jgi:phage-related protein
MNGIRSISWFKAAKKDFREFPADVQKKALDALTMAAAGEYPDIAKPFQGFGSGVLELVMPFKGDAFRVIYAVQVGTDLWVVHAFQKKSTKGIATPARETDVIKKRLKSLRGR